MTKFTSTLLAALICIALAGCETEPYERPIGPGNWILVDQFHTRLQNPSDHRLYKWNYAYQGVHGYSRLFDHLGHNGYPWSAMRELRLSDERLEGFKVLFINLLHDQRPDFEKEELDAIERFVKNGGGLVMIVDHTNVYRHAERANRVLQPMGVEVLYHSALDFAPNTVSGTGWIAIKNFTEHPVNTDIDMISFQTGGPVNKKHGVAFLSERGFADYWDESETGGFYGNWRHDGDEKLEPKGTDVALVAAAQYGKGRVAVIGDQNIYGDAWLHFGHNFQHALNIFEWAAGQDQTNTPLRKTRPTGLNIAHNITLTQYSPGKSGYEHYYALFVNWNRDTTITGRGAIDIKPEEQDVLVLTSPSVAPTEDTIKQIKDFLNAGKRVVLTFESNKISTNTSIIDYVQALAPEMKIEAGDKVIDFSKPREEVLLAIQTTEFPQVAKAYNLSSSFMEVDDFVVAAYLTKKKDDETIYEPYTLNIQTDWGEPLIQAKASTRIDIARKKRVGDGELIIFIQDGFWKNKTLGDKETSPPSTVAVDAVRLQYEFIDYLKTPIR